MKSGVVISKRWCSVYDKLREEKSIKRRKLHLEEGPLTWFDAAKIENSVRLFKIFTKIFVNFFIFRALKTLWQIRRNDAKVEEIDAFLFIFNEGNRLTGVELSITIETDELQVR